MSEERFTISIVDVDINDNKTFIDFEISDEFQKWFVKTHCPSNRFNKGEFKGWMRRALHQALVTLDQGKYKRIFSRMYGESVGSCNPREGDIIVFFKDGYRTRIVSKVTNKTVELEKLYEGDTYRRISHGDIFEITRPRSR